MIMQVGPLWVPGFSGVHAPTKTYIFSTDACSQTQLRSLFSHGASNVQQTQRPTNEKRALHQHEQRTAGVKQKRTSTRPRETKTTRNTHTHTRQSENANAKS